MKTVWRYPRSQFQCFRIITGLCLFIYFISLLWGESTSGHWTKVFPVLAWKDLITTFPNLLSLIPLGLLLGVLSVASLGVAAGLQRKFLSSLLLYGLGCLYEGEVLSLTPTSIALFSVLIIFLVTPEKEHDELKWRFPYGLFILGHSMIVFAYLLILNPFTLPELLMTGKTGTMPMILSLFFTLGILTLVLKQKRYIFWFFSFGLLLYGACFILTPSEIFIFFPLLFLTIDPRWWITEEEQGRPLILYYDGACGLCQKAVRFALENDGQEKMQFSALQSEQTKKRVPVELHPFVDQLDGVILEREGQFFIKSRAVLWMLYEFGGLWRMISFLRYLPQGLLDVAYDLIARYRIRLFGSADICALPDPKRRERFLEGQYEQESSE